MKKKQEQIVINLEVENMLESFMERVPSDLSFNGKRLRTMSAEVMNYERWYVLKSYNTIIALIDKETDTCYDFLRLVYGYTATSAKHVSAFDHEYGSGTWGCAKRLTWREV